MTEPLFMLDPTVWKLVSEKEGCEIYIRIRAVSWPPAWLEWK
jgi:hypothetical protein